MSVHIIRASTFVQDGGDGQGMPSHKQEDWQLPAALPHLPVPRFRHVHVPSPLRARSTCGLPASGLSWRTPSSREVPWASVQGRSGRNRSMAAGSGNAHASCRSPCAADRAVSGIECLHPASGTFAGAFPEFRPEPDSSVPSSDGRRHHVRPRLQASAPETCRCPWHADSACGTCILEAGP